PVLNPYQPPGYWSYLNSPKREWQKDAGESEYRRGLYTWWQRTFLHPGLLAFDAPTREECTAERSRSSTPLQALVLLNDPVFLEAARVFAERTLREGGPNVEAKLAWAMQQAVSRDIRPAETQLLVDLYQKHRKDYEADRSAAQKAVSVGDWAVPKGLDMVELAAWTSVARVILNLHETITRN